jgi:hypothetical protein
MRIARTGRRVMLAIILGVATTGAWGADMPAAPAARDAAAAQPGPPAGAVVPATRAAAPGAAPSGAAAPDQGAEQDWAVRFGTQRGALRRQSDLGQPGARSAALQPEGGILDSHDYTRLYGGETATPPVGSTVSGPEMGPGNARR